MDFQIIKIISKIITIIWDQMEWDRKMCSLIQRL